MAVSQKSDKRMNLRKLFQALRGRRVVPNGGRSGDALSAHPVAIADSAAVTQATDGLDLHIAVTHHLEWCALFSDRLHRANSMLSETEAHLPDAHESGLGQWLTRASTQWVEHRAVLAELQREHHRLHRLAIQALVHARNGRMDLASTLLNTDFERSRNRVLETLRDLQAG